jgi:hypothetical protein
VDVNLSKAVRSVLKKFWLMIRFKEDALLAKYPEDPDNWLLGYF